MMLYKKVQLVVMVCFVSVLMMAESDLGNNPADILSVALKNKKRLNYKLTTVKTYPELHLKTTEYFYNKANPDGTNYTRYEEHAKEGGVSGSDGLTVIKNAEGEFHVHSGNVYKLNYEKEEKGFAEKDLPTEGETAEYKLEDAEVNGNPCYKITKRVKPDYAALENYKKFLPEWYVRENQSRLKEECKNQFPVVQIYYIDKQKLLPWKYDFYNISAKKIFTHEYQKIEILKNIGDELFGRPRNSPVLVFDNPEKYSKASNEAVVKIVEENIKNRTLKVVKKELREQQENDRKKQIKGPGITGEIGSYIDSNFNTITSILSTVLFWVSVGLFAFVGIYKFRKRKCAK